LDISIVALIVSIVFKIKSKETPKIIGSKKIIKLRNSFEE